MDVHGTPAVKCEIYGPHGSPERGVLRHSSTGVPLLLRAVTFVWHASCM